MKTFKRGNIVYDVYMDPEVVELCDALNSLPGIRTTSSCSGHGTESVSIFFEVREPQSGFFFLVRCVDRRYWEFGRKWSITVSVGDRKQDDYLPVVYLLESQSVGQQAYGEIRSLIDNINHHLNHENFIKGYQLDMSRFDLVEK